jgi:hypothetical protein
VLSPDFNSYHFHAGELPVANRTIAAAGNTVVPALLALSELGFSVTVPASPERQWVAIRGQEEFLADDPVTLLGLIKLVEVRTWNWGASDKEIEATLDKYQLR